MTPKQSKDMLYNSRIIDTYIKMLKKQHPEIDAGIALEYANMQGYQVADQSHWFTQKQIDQCRFSHIGPSYNRNSYDRIFNGFKPLITARNLMQKIVDKLTHAVACHSTYGMDQIDTERVELVR